MAKREGALGARRRVDPMLVSVLLLCTLFTLVSIAGCGGRVIVGEEDLDPDEALQDEAGTGDSGGSTSGSGGGSTPATSGACVACDGQADCAFCLIHGFTTTYVCPSGESPHKLGCLHLGEEHTSVNGSFTCYYCTL